MRTRIALSNLTHNSVRTAVSLAGVGFAIVLIFLQLGFRGAVATTATLIYEKLDYHVMLRSPDYMHLCDARFIPRDRLSMVASLPEVADVTPFHVMLNNWQSPKTGEGRGIIVMGAEPARMPLKEVQDLDQVKVRSKLSVPENVLIDDKTRWTYGPQDDHKFGDEDIGVTTDIGGKRVRLAGHFSLGTGLAASGAVLTSEAGFARLSLYDVSKYASMGLVRLKEPFAESPQKLRQFITKLEGMIDDKAMTVLSKHDVETREQNHWLWDTPIGAIFLMGVVIAFVVGAAIVYMVLSADVTKHLAEYATLNAMGYSQRYLSQVIMEQALLMAVAGFLPGAVVAEGLYRLTSHMAGIPVEMDNWRRVFVLALSMLMCVLSGGFALRKLRKADPAELF